MNVIFGFCTIVIDFYCNFITTLDGGDKSNKAFNYTICLSNLSGAEITIVHIIKDNSELEGSSVGISNKPEPPSSFLSDASANLNAISPKASKKTQILKEI
jgi:hypothetical protein